MNSAYQCFFTLNMLLEKADRRVGHEKNLLGTIYIVFFLKIVMDDLN